MDWIKNQKDKLRKIKNFTKRSLFFYKTLYFSRLKKSPLIYVAGDSHTLSFSFQSPFITNHLGPVTAFNILKEQSTTSSKEKLFLLASKINKKKDFLMVSFGEIDCRIHVYSQYKKRKEIIPIEQIIDQTINNYFIAINKLLEMNLKIVIYGIPPANYQKNVYAYEYYAESGLQAEIKKSFNKKLKERCIELNLKYLEIFYEFSDKDGFILPDFSSDEIHLNDKIVPFIKKWYKEQLNVIVQ